MKCRSFVFQCRGKAFETPFKVKPPFSNCSGLVDCVHVFVISALNDKYTFRQETLKTTKLLHRNEKNKTNGYITISRTLSNYRYLCVSFCLTRILILPAYQKCEFPVHESLRVFFCKVASKRTSLLFGKNLAMTQRITSPYSRSKDLINGLDSLQERPECRSLESEEEHVQNTT